MRTQNFSSGRLIYRVIRLRLRKLLRSLKLLSGLLFIQTALLSCAHVEIKDAEVCADLGSQGATCDHWLTSQPRDVPKSQWDNEREFQLCISPGAWADLKQEIESLCSLSKKCDYDTQAKIQAAFTRVTNLTGNR